MSWNESLFDEILRHQVGVQRLGTREIRKTLTLLNKANRELTSMLSSRMVDNMTTRRLQSMLVSVQNARQALWLQLGDTARAESIAAQSHKAMQTGFQNAIGVQLNYATVSTARLAALVNTSLIQVGPGAAYTLKQWWGTLARADVNRITGAIQMGVALEQTIPQIVRNVRATFPLTSANAATVVRTGVNHASNVGRDEFFNANNDIIESLRWTSTLDGRTSPVCRARDGHFTLPEGKEGTPPEPRLEPPEARPPAHPNCRSVMVASVDPDGADLKMGERPFVRDERTRRIREKDFRAEAKAKAGDSWKGMSERDRRALIRDQRQAWVRQNVGTVPAHTTYNDWLKRQPASFQNQVLGKQRAELFRRGDVTVQDFVDRSGRQIPLAARPAAPVKRNWVDSGAQSPPELDRLHSQLRSDWIASGRVTEAGYKALDSYSGQAFMQINGSLRSGATATGHTAQHIKQLDKVFARGGVMDADRVLYRTAYLDNQTAQSMFGGALPRAGVMFGDRGYVSTSLGRGVWDFGVGEMQYFRGSVYNMRIRVPRGSRVAYPRSYGDEYEAVLNRGSRFRVTGQPRRVGSRLIDVDDRTFRVPVYEIDVELVP